MMCQKYGVHEQYFESWLPKAKIPCLFSGLRFYPFVYFGSHVLSNCIALLGSTALLAKAYICYGPVIEKMPFYINIRIGHVLEDHRKIRIYHYIPK